MKRFIPSGLQNLCTAVSLPPRILFRNLSTRQTSRPISLLHQHGSYKVQTSRLKIVPNHHHHHHHRALSTTPTMATTAAQEKKDWSAAQYLKFNNERTRPVYDLVSQLSAHLSSSPSPRIYDLGCGPGNSTKVILDHFPTARITGMDSSPDMLQKAKAALPNVEFVAADVSTFKVDAKADLLFSNALFQWLRSSHRIPTLAALFHGLSTGAVVAVQAPDNYDEPSHALMRVTAALADSPWAPFFKDTRIGDLSDAQRPDLDPMEAPAQFYNALVPHASSVNVWQTRYYHVLDDAKAIVEWVKATGLQPFLNRIEDEAAKKAFLHEYEKRVEEAYPRLADGKVLLVYPRLFVVAVRK